MDRCVGQRSENVSGRLKRTLGRVVPPALSCTCLCNSDRAGIHTDSCAVFIQPLIAHGMLIPQHLRHQLRPQ